MTPKAKIPVTIRVDQADIIEWTQQAKLRGLSISEWIRRACNGVGLMAKEGLHPAGMPGGPFIRHDPEKEAHAIVSGAGDGEPVIPPRPIHAASPTVAHDPRCSCLACKPPKKEKVKS
jgi:hypothetical protein